MRNQQKVCTFGKFLMFMLVAISMFPGKIYAGDDLYETLQILKFDEPTAAPDFKLASVDGGEKTLGDFKGKVILLNFWATWCTYCRSERAGLQATYEAYKEKGLEVVAISIDRDNIDTVKAFVEEKKLTFPNLHDPKNEIGLQYAARAIPMTYFLNRAGKAIGVVIGPRSWESEDMKTILTQLLDEKEPSGDASQSINVTTSATPAEHSEKQE